jgi:curved DNA-binding protein CbpA
MVKNYYFILGVPDNASTSDITYAYKEKERLAARDAMEAAMLGEAAEAYECLVNQSRRMEYDRMMRIRARPAGEPRQHVSPESLMKVELEFKKLRGKHDAKKKIVKKLIFAAMFLIFAGIGIRHGIKHFPGGNLSGESPVSAKAKVLDTRIGPSARTYEMRTGGVVVNDRAPCRAQPSGNAAVTATMRKDTVIFATKEIRDDSGTVWYYVFNSLFEGWANGADVRIYNRY